MAANTVRDVVLLQSHQNASENMLVLGAHPPRMPNPDIVRAIKHRAVPLSQVSPDLVGKLTPWLWLTCSRLDGRLLFFQKKQGPLQLYSQMIILLEWSRVVTTLSWTLICSSLSHFQACQLVGPCQSYSWKNCYRIGSSSTSNKRYFLFLKYIFMSSFTVVGFKSHW